MLIPSSCGLLSNGGECSALSQGSVPSSFLRSLQNPSLPKEGPFSPNTPFRWNLSPAYTRSHWQGAPSISSANRLLWLKVRLKVRTCYEVCKWDRVQACDLSDQGSRKCRSCRDPRCLPGTVVLNFTINGRQWLHLEARNHHWEKIPKTKKRFCSFLMGEYGVCLHWGGTPRPQLPAPILSKKTQEQNQVIIAKKDIFSDLSV